MNWARRCSNQTGIHSPRWNWSEGATVFEGWWVVPAGAAVEASADAEVVGDSEVAGEVEDSADAGLEDDFDDD